jgi:hypothetical protein
MSSEPAASARPSRPSATRRAAETNAPEVRKTQVSDELQAMMRDVPISARLMQVLDDLENLAAQDEAANPGESPDTQGTG